MTNFVEGVQSFGVPVLPFVGQVNPYGQHWFVNGGSAATGQSGVGNDGHDGKTPDTAFLTMDAAFDRISSGDTIHLMGRVREQLNTPSGVFDVTIIGPSPVTRHPDAHTSNGGYSSARWDAPASPTASDPLLDIRQQGWRVLNVLFTGDEDDSVGCIRLFRDGGSGDDERDASHAWIQGCRFQSGLYGIQDSGGCARVKIIDNEFLLFWESDNDAIVNVVGAGIGTMWGWQILGNKFYGNYSDIDISATGPIIRDNDFMYISLGETNTIAIDLTGAAEESVSRNFMYVASNEASVVNARFVASSTPAWGPNFYTDVEEYGEPAE